MSNRTRNNLELAISGVLAFSITYLLAKISVYLVILAIPISFWGGRKLAEIQNRREQS